MFFFLHPSSISVRESTLACAREKYEASFRIDSKPIDLYDSFISAFKLPQSIACYGCGVGVKLYLWIIFSLFINYDSIKNCPFQFLQFAWFTFPSIWVGNSIYGAVRGRYYHWFTFFFLHPASQLCQKLHFVHQRNSPGNENVSMTFCLFFVAGNVGRHSFGRQFYQEHVKGHDLFMLVLHRCQEGRKAWNRAKQTRSNEINHFSWKKKKRMEKANRRQNPLNRIKMVEESLDSISGMSVEKCQNLSAFFSRGTSCGNLQLNWATFTKGI